MNTSNNLKIHLGCGQRYLKGYINIDYPSSKHTVLAGLKSDLEADLRELRYTEGSVGEIRLHHVFEHFTRAVACALIVSWRSWLNKGGLLRIEVPDFDKAALHILNPLTTAKKRMISLRHIFGSNEAPWAVHYEGWSAKRLASLLKNLGFDIQKIKKNSWKGTYNIEILATKNTETVNQQEFQIRVKKFLYNFLVDDSPGEQELLKIWMDSYRRQLKQSLASNHKVQINP